MKVYISSDHAGFEMKKELIPYLQSLNYEVEDAGPFEYSAEDDYPDYVIPVCQKIQKDISENIDSRGIIIGGSGQGEGICANRFQDIRAMVYLGQPVEKNDKLVPDAVVLSREHNNSNVLSMGARFISIENAKSAVHKWLSADFSGDERHVRRLKKFQQYGS